MRTAIQEFENQLYWLCRRRRSKTLAAWVYELNSWKWPKPIPQPESRSVEGNPRRNAAMTAILKELGWRMAATFREE